LEEDEVAAVEAAEDAEATAAEAGG